MAPEIVRYLSGAWSRRAAEGVQTALNDALGGAPRCSVMLTGGRSAERLYEAWKELPAFRCLTDVDFYFGDERCVPPEAEDSNYGLAMRTLFREGVPGACVVHRMKGEASDREGSARAYERLLPDSVDVLLLGVGEDGHVASIFPGDGAMLETRRRIVRIVAPKPPRHRLTITPPVITAARRVFVLAPGGAKASVLAKLLTHQGETAELPARLVGNATWLTDTPLSEGAIV